MRDAVQVPVLTYHSVDDSGSVISLSKETFEQHVSSLHRWGYRPLRLLDAVRLVRSGQPLPPRHVILTFDDGFRNNLTVAAPILERYGFTATVFVATGFTGASNSWPRQHPSIPELPMMTAAELRRIRAAGIDLGAHTHTHPFLAELEPTEARAEILRSRDELSQHIGEPVPLFSYPYGSFNEYAREVVSEHFEGAISIRLGRMRSDGDLYAIERINATAGLMRALPFRVLACGEFGLFLALKRAKDRLRQFARGKRT